MKSSNGIDGKSGRSGFWQKHVGAWSRESSTQTEYCLRHKLKLSAFGYWKRKLAQESAPAKFVEVCLKENPQPFESSSSNIKLLIGDGFTIEVADGFNPDSLMWQEIRSGPLINMDETTVQVMKEPGRPDTSKSYMWVLRGGEVKKPVLLFQYEPSRSGEIPKRYLGDYEAYLQTDGYKGYDALGERPGIVHLGCWAHARRKFMEAFKSIPKREKKNKSHARVALDYIRRLYDIERECDAREVSFEDRGMARRERAVPILDEFRKWLDETSLKTPPRGLLGKAVSYTLNQWGKLTRYTEDGRLRPDNNLAENAIRPFVVGRKNCLFNGSPRGAKASATIYSLIETAKANRLEPYRYLRYLFERLPYSKSQEDCKALLLSYINQQTLDTFRF